MYKLALVAGKFCSFKHEIIDGCGIQDEADIAIAHDRGTAYKLYIVEWLVKRFFNDLLLLQEFVDYKTNLFVCIADDNDVYLLIVIHPFKGPQH